MRNLLLMVLLTLPGCTSSAQTRDAWIAFWNKDSTLIGYKDKNGKVKIKPQFTSLTSAARFDDIIAATEETAGGSRNYYLTKRGRIVGRDSLYIFDNGVDCESEGFIRFQDPKTDKTGLFNKAGDIVVPAVYDELSRVRNGLIVALRGAEKKQMGEHFSWAGGREFLIDTNNKIVIRDFKYDDDLNFYSVLISPAANADTTRQNFIGVNGQNYSFISFTKEFKQWLKSSLSGSFTKNDLLAATAEKVIYWQEAEGWVSEAKSGFMDRNFGLLKTKLLELASADCDYSIFSEGLNPYLYEPGKYQQYFNNCGESKDWMYPVKDIVISYNEKSGLVQDHLEFLRTDNGYKLISVTIRKGALK